MSPLFTSSRRHYDPVARMLGGGALCVSLAALVFAMTGLSTAQQGAEPAATVAAARRAARSGARAKPKPALPVASTKPKALGLLRLNKQKKFPASVLPKVAAARVADRVGDATREDLALNCPHVDDVDLGTWCLQSATYPVPPEEIGKNDFAFAAKKCVDQGGWLPSAAQLIGAADRVKLSGTLDDNESSASVDEDPTDGRKDQREMSASLFTIGAGASAAGSQGVTPGARGNPNTAEPDPVPFPADPMPDTLQYVTVYDNLNRGGFAGGKPVGAAERFRCAFAKAQGDPTGEG